MSQLRIVAGEKIYHSGNHHPCRVTGTIWYRHDTVYDGERKLEGFIQVKERRLRILGRDMRQNRIETATCFKGSCVTGTAPDWLLRMNNEVPTSVS